MTVLLGIAHGLAVSAVLIALDCWFWRRLRKAIRDRSDQS